MDETTFHEVRQIKSIADHLWLFREPSYSFLSLECLKRQKESSSAELLVDRLIVNKNKILIICTKYCVDDLLQLGILI